MKNMIVLLILLSITLTFNINNVTAGSSLKDILYSKEGVHNGFNVMCSIIIGSVIIGTPLFFIVKIVTDQLQSQDKEKKQQEEAQKRINKKNEMMKQQQQQINGGATKKINHDSYGSTKKLKEVIEKTPSIGHMFTSTSTTSTPSNQSPSKSSPCSLKNSTELTPPPPYSSSYNGYSSNNNNGNNNIINSVNDLLMNSASASRRNTVTINNNSLNSNSILQSHATLNSNCEYYKNSNTINEQHNEDNNSNTLRTSPPSPVISTFGRASFNNGLRNSHHSDISPILESNFYQNRSRKSTIDDGGIAIEEREQKNKALIDSIDSLMNATITSSQQFQIRHGKEVTASTIINNNNCSGATPPISATSGNNTPTRQSMPPTQQLPLLASMSSNNNSPSNSGFRPKSLTMSQNISLLNYLSTNVTPKDQWNCVVQRLLELFTSFLLYTNNQSSHGKYTDSNSTSQAAFTALQLVESSISNFSENEKLKKKLPSDQLTPRYFSPITFELYNKIPSAHELIRNSKRTNERDITGIVAMFSILIPTLFKSFTKYMDEDIEQKRKQLERTKYNLQEFTSISLLSSYQSKKLTHKVSMYNLLEFIKNVVPVGYKSNSLNTIWTIIDQLHYIGGEIDKLLFHCEEFKKEMIDQHQQSSNSTSSSNNSTLQNSKSRGSIGIDHDILDMVKLELFQMSSKNNNSNNDTTSNTTTTTTTTQPIECTIDITNLNIGTPTTTTLPSKPHIPPIKVGLSLINNGPSSPRGGLGLSSGTVPRYSPRSISGIPASPRIQALQQQHSPRMMSSQLSPRLQPVIPTYELNKMDDDLKFLDFLNTNNNSINRSINNKLDIIDNKLAINSKSPSILKDGTICVSMEKQKSILSTCYKNLEQALNLFSSSERFTSKCKSDSIPILKLLLSTIQNLEDIIDTGMSIEQMQPTELLEWVNNYSKIQTSLNNTIIKNNTLNNNIINSNNNSNNNNNSNSNNTQQNRSKIRTLSSPFGMPDGNISTTASNNTTTNNIINGSKISPRSPRGNGNNNTISPRSSPKGSPRLYSLGVGDENDIMGSNNDSLILKRIKEFKFPSLLDRSLHIVDISQENIMISILSSFSLSFKELKNRSNSSSPYNSSPNLSSSPISSPPPQLPVIDDPVTLEFFNNSIAIFLASIRTSVFCSSLLISPWYSQLQ